MTWRYRIAITVVDIAFMSTLIYCGLSTKVLIVIALWVMFSFSDGVYRGRTES